MATYKGTIKQNDLEGGFWELHADDGERYQLASSDRALLNEGQRVTIEGDVDGGAMGIGMTGPTLNVTKWTRG